MRDAAEEEIPLCKENATRRQYGIRTLRIRGVIGLWYNYNRTEGKKIILEEDRLVALVIQ